jgi:UDP-N-acetylglucosamine 2-epimerase (non-hydrolysing)
MSDVCNLFGVKPDIELHIMKPNQDLFYITSAVLEKMREVLLSVQPSLVIVQGDTTTAMASALAAFYLKIPVAHVEAGLRSGNKYGPFPEECNRSCIARLATYHFAPTHIAHAQLIAEQIDPKDIFYTGNTVVDALRSILHQIYSGTVIPSPEIVELVAAQKLAGNKIILLTAHRRESFDGGLDRIFSALYQVLQRNPDLCVIYPVHPNPCIKQALARTQLDQLSNIVLMPPIVYHDLLYVLDACHGVATDSGGITEEAVSLSKPVVLLRNETDRPEGIALGMVQLVGTHEQSIIDGISWMLSYTGIADGVSPYGDGHACEKIVKIIQDQIVHTEDM